MTWLPWTNASHYCHTHVSFHLFNCLILSHGKLYITTSGNSFHYTMNYFVYLTTSFELHAGTQSSIWVNICLIYMTTIKHNSKNKPLDSYTTRLTKSKGRVHCSTSCSTEYAPLPFFPILCNTGTNICPCKFSFLNQHVHFTRRVIKRAYSSWNLLILHTATKQLIRVLWLIVYTLTKQSLTLIQINLEFKWRFKTQPLTLFCVFICCFRIRWLASQL